MKTLKASWLFTGGALFGLSIALCLGAVTKTNTAQSATAPAEAPQKVPWAHVNMIGYPNGATGFFDQTTGTVYVYDGQLRTCYLIRQLRTLGDPMQ